MGPESFKSPPATSSEAEPKYEAMNEEQTLQFLREHGVKPLTRWLPRQPLLYVLEEQTRSDEGPYGDRPKEQRPSIVRLDEPTAIHFDAPHHDVEDPGRVVYKLETDGGRIDYYAIDAKTKTPVLLWSRDTKTKNYNVRAEGLFSASDELFPKGKN